MLTAIFSLLFTIGTAQAEIQYQSVEATKTGKSFREFWDSTGTFCFKNEKTPDTCYRISTLGEVKLREGGQWLESPFLNTLSDEVKKRAEAYDRIFVRYLSFGEQGAYAVHIFFVTKGSLNRSSQTIFAFGQREGARAPLASMSMSSALEEFGATLWARSQISPNQQIDERAINQKIVEGYKPLLNVAESVVEAYLRTDPAAPKLP